MEFDVGLGKLHIYQPKVDHQGTSIPFVLDVDADRVKSSRKLRKLVKNGTLKLSVKAELRSFIRLEFPSRFRGTAKIDFPVFVSSDGVEVYVGLGQSLVEELRFPGAKLLPGLVAYFERSGDPNSFLRTHPLYLMHIGTEALFEISVEGFGRITSVLAPISCPTREISPADFVARTLRVLHEFWLSPKDGRVSVTFNIYSSNLTFSVPVVEEIENKDLYGGAVPILVSAKNRESEPKNIRLKLSLIRRGIAFGKIINETLLPPAGFTAVLSGFSEVKSIDINMVLARTLQEGWNFAKNNKIADPYILPYGLSSREILLPYIIYNPSEVTPLLEDFGDLVMAYGVFVRFDLSWEKKKEVVEIPVAFI